MNSSGMALSGGIGKMAAQWVANGEPELSMYEYDIRYDHTFTVLKLLLLFL